MKAIFNILAILAIGAGVFFSYDLSSKFKGQQEIRLKAVADNKKTTDDAVRTEADLKEEQAGLKKALDEQQLADQSISALKSAESGFKRDLATQNAALEDQKAQFADLDKALAEINKTVNDLGADVTLDNLPEKVKELENKKLDLQKKKDELATLVDAATKKRESQQAETGRLADTKTKRDARIRKNSLETVVTAVNQEWGFVMVGAGSNTGFSPQTKLLVERDGRLIGKIQPTSIEPNQTLADIDFDSLAAGVRIQPGDRVILAEPASN